MEYNEKQLQILKIAEELFALHGFDGTSVRDIAREADVNVAMISYYFGSKEKLLSAIFQRRAETVKLEIESLLGNKDLDPLEKIFKLIDTFIEKVISQQSYYKLMICLQVTETEGSILEALDATKRRNHELIKKLVQEGQDAGVFKQNIDVPMMMTTLFGTANQFVSTQKFYRRISNLEHLSEEEFQKHLKEKLNTHLKGLFKATLTNE
ncbi:TetR/AcrR family transcriptional regulator [Polluticoccus soli]|uniref:TetR/AcrR family transcriptional regulator n=1 Tax=Polluticoccus soli TaxID=3034150 RepID=UPI0023E34F1D|nr:TetR family transcriptional regulator [Flavipsychrobacter sp. JY13-12]